MDTAVISALIGACSGLLIQVVGQIIGPDKLFWPTPNKKVLQLQLDQFYSPAMCLFLSHEKSESCTLNALRTLANKNIALVPHNLMVVLFPADAAVSDAFSMSRDIVVANFNWAKKILGYPYHAANIYGSYIQTWENRKRLEKIIKIQTFSFGLCYPVFCWLKPFLVSAGIYTSLGATVVYSITSTALFVSVLNLLFVDVPALLRKKKRNEKH